MIIIREISEDDCQMYIERIAELLYMNDKAHDYTESCTYDESLFEASEMGKYISDDKADVFCAFDESMIVGLIWGFPFKFRDEMRFHIKAMVVDPDYRKKGLSQLLLASIEKAAIERSINIIDTYVDQSNITARKSYEKFGLKPDRILIRKVIE